MKKQETAKSDPKANAAGFAVVLRAVRRHQFVAAGLLLVSLAVGAAVWVFLPLPKMTAFVLFHVSSQPQFVFTASGNEARDSATSYRQAQAVWIKSRPVLNAALSKPEITNNNFEMLRGQENQVAWLENKLQVDFKTGPEFMRLSLEGDNADEMKALLDAVRDVYLKDVVDKDKNKRWARYLTLEKVHTQYNKTLETTRRTIRSLAEDVGTGEPAALGVKEKFLQEQIGTAQRELLQVQSEMRRAEIETKNAEGKVEGMTRAQVSDDMITAAVKADSTYQKLLARQIALRESVADLSRDTARGARPPILVKREEDLDLANQELESYAAKIRPQVAKRLRESAVGDTKRSFGTLQERLAVMKELERTIAKEIDELTRRVRTNNVAQVDLEGYKNEIAQTEKMADRIRQEMETLKPELESPARVTVWEEPVVIAGIDGNRRLKYSLLAGFASLFAGLGFITFLEARNRRIVTADEVSGTLGLKVIGTMPSLPRRSNRHVIHDPNRMSGWQHALTECVDTTRTLLIHAREAEKIGRSFMITSALPHEGKTMLACHLGASLARAGYKTLLVDGDLRRPTVHRVLKTTLLPGLCELLRGEAAVADAVQASLVPGMSVLPAGSWDRRIPLTLSGDRWPTIKGQLEREFDYVLLDSSPLLLVTDSLLMARSLDGVVMSVLWNVTPLDSVAQARDRLDALGIKVFGVVINGVAFPGYYSAMDYYKPIKREESAEPAVSQGRGERS